MTRRLAPALLLALVCLWPLPSAAQDAQTDPPAHISFVDGAAVLERDGRPETAPSSMPLLAGDRIRTQGGRVEVLFADGSALHLDANTVVDFQSDDVVRMLAGRLRLSIAGPARDVGYRVDAPSAWVQINDPGEYRIAMVRDDEIELAVLRGAAELINEQGRSYIRAGERTFARAGAAPSPSYVFNSAAWDSFDRWSEARRDRADRRLRAVPAGRRAALYRRVRFLRLVAARRELRLRLVSTGAGRMAAVSPRPLGQPASIWLDVGRE